MLQVLNLKIDGATSPNTVTLPSFIKFNQADGKINIVGTNQSEGKHTYEFILQATDESSGVTDAAPFTFTVKTIIFNSAPYFSKLPENKAVSINIPQASTDFWQLP